MHSAACNLKKAGIFPLVHGVRSLALARHVDTTSTVDASKHWSPMARWMRRWGGDAESCTC
jgi:signal-transduction protein with cAMP-binding, CBS, and nucleotidyltransferase domain